MTSTLESYYVADLLRKHAYRTGRFVLSSGRESKEYLDVKNAILGYEAGPEIAKIIELTIRRSFVAPIPVAGVVLGGALLAVRVAERLHRGAVAVRSEVREHGTKTRIEGAVRFSPGDSFVLIEDVLTTGRSVLLAAEALEVAGFVVRQVIAVVDRGEGGIEAVVAALPEAQVSVLTTLNEVREQGVVYAR